MDTRFNQQELLLFTTTSFSRRVFNNKIDDSKNLFTDVRQQLEEACWNGIVKEILESVVKEPAIMKKLFMWSIEEGRSFLCIELAEQPPHIRFLSSLNPNLFLHCINLN